MGGHGSTGLEVDPLLSENHSYGFFMDAQQARNELRTMKMRDLFRLASEQKISECLVGAKACGLYVSYKNFRFCISELLGESCIYQKSERLKTREVINEGENPHLPWDQAFLNSLLPLERKGVPFKVYCRDESTRAIILLGETIERRREERKDNLRDLLIKARHEFSNQVSNPAMIFLLGP